MEKKKRSIGRLILGFFLALLCALLVAAVALFTWLTVTEYKPAPKEAMSLSGTAAETLHKGDTFKLMSWNIGYCALGDDADFFMEGGDMVRGSDEARVRENLMNIITGIRKVGPDVLFLQEVDSDSTRSYHIDQTQIMDDLDSNDTSSEALYYSVKFVPYPVPPIGEVHTSLQTLSNYPVSESTRVQLPVPFSWPVRTANLKRCLLIDRVPVKGSDKELVLINLHLEAYDDGEGKAAQTEQLLKVMEEEYEKGNYVVAAGDFNQTFSNTDTSAYPQQEGLWSVDAIDTKVFAPDFKMYMDSSVPTCRGTHMPYKGADPETFQYYMIDGFIVSANLDVESVKTVDYGFVSSDHNPVVLQAALK